MSTAGGRDRARRLAFVLGVVVLGLAVALGVFIRLVPRDLRPPEDVPRAVAIAALYATTGLLAIVGALQRRPSIVAAAGVLCLVGTILSVATIAFAVPGILLILLGPRIRAVLSTRRRSEPLIAAATALLVMTEGRCWQATGSPASPTYEVIPCNAEPVMVGGGQTFASGYDSGVLTTQGGFVEAALLLGALVLVAVTGRTPIVAGAEPSTEQAPPR